MSSGSFIGVTPGSGAKISTGPSYTEAGNIVQDQKVILGEQYLASYVITAGLVSLATASSHLIQIMAGSSLNVRIRRIEIWPNGFASTPTVDGFNLLRLTSAGTGGTVMGLAAMNPADAAAGATSMTLPTVKGVESNSLLAANCGIWSAAPTAGTYGPLIAWELDGEHLPPVVIAAGTANGVAIKNAAGVTGGSVAINIWLTESPF